MFDKYYDKIMVIKTFDKEDILNKKIELYNKNNMTIYNAPHNGIFNDEAKRYL